MSAHSAGAASQSQRKVERSRQAIIDQQRELKVQRETYLQSLATKLAQECGISEKIAIARVKALSVSAKQSQR
jgi:hypothetical protein